MTSSSKLTRFHYLHSISEGKGNEFKGVVVGRDRKRSLTGAISVLLRVAGVRTFFKIKQFSPFFLKTRVAARTNIHLKVR